MPDPRRDPVPVLPPPAPWVAVGPPDGRGARQLHRQLEQAYAPRGDRWSARASALFIVGSAALLWGAMIAAAIAFG